MDLSCQIKAFFKKELTITRADVLLHSLQVQMGPIPTLSNHMIAATFNIPLRRPSAQLTVLGILGFGFLGVISGVLLIYNNIRSVNYEKLDTAKTDHLRTIS